MNKPRHPLGLILVYVLNFSESEIPSQERKNFKSSPEIQVGNLFTVVNEKTPLFPFVKIIETKHVPFNLFTVMPLHLSSLPQEPIRPLEKRALNFLVNEYLLKNEYKLSSITFSDENDDQVNLRLCVCVHFSV